MLLCAGKVLVDADTAPEVIRLEALLVLWVTSM